MSTVTITHEEFNSMRKEIETLKEEKRYYLDLSVSLINELTWIDNYAISGISELKREGFQYWNDHQSTDDLNDCLIALGKHATGDYSSETQRRLNRADQSQLPFQIDNPTWVPNYIVANRFQLQLQEEWLKRFSFNDLSESERYKVLQVIRGQHN